MKKLTLTLALLIGLFSKPLIAQEVIISEEEMVDLINSSFKNYTLYEGKDIPDKDLHSTDLNQDGTPEWVVVPATACGDTQNCTFFAMQYDQKKKKWLLLLMADGKTTPLTPWGYVEAPRKTKGYPDLITVFDMGPDGKGGRLLERHIFVWNGKKYEEFKGASYPPEAPSSEMTNLLAQVDQLKFQKTGGPVKKKPVLIKKKKSGGAPDVYVMPSE
ncbi:MAG: hypothetical protein JNK65_07025 [Deltaproteobacteria bacterium]|nr:hypothetical protein [Deltaproteobacteria bacterium]